MSSPLKLPSFWIAWVVVLFVLRLFATLGAPTWLWGLDSLADRSPQWWLFLAAFALPLSAPLMLKVGAVVSGLPGKSFPLLLSLTAALGAVFALFRSHNFLLGDSLLYVHALREGIQIESAGRREAGATLFVSALHWCLRRTVLTDSLVPFIVASVVAGILYVLLALAICRMAASSPQTRGLVFASLLALGSLQVFFGHAEYYSLVAASGMLYVFLSLRWLKGRGSLVYPALALAGALFVHVMSAILVPSFAWLLFCAARRRRLRDALAAAVLAPALLVSAAALIRYPWESFLMIFSRGKHMLPLLGHDPDFYAYGLFSPAHLLELGNVLLLAAPCLPLLVLAASLPARSQAPLAAPPDGNLPGRAATDSSELGAAGWAAPDGSASGAEARSTGDDDHGAGGFFAAAAAGAGTFAFVANPALGMARDWDIFAFPFMILTLAAAAAAARRLKGRRHVLWLCGAVTVIGSLHLAFFVGANRVKSAYVPRFRRIAMQGSLFAPTPRAELWRYLGWEALNMGDTEQAREDLLRSIRDHTTQVKAYKMLAVLEIGRKFDWLASGKGSARRRALELDSEDEVTAEAARLGLEQYYTWTELEAPNKVRAYLGAGIAAIKVGAPDSLIVNAFKRAAEADPEDLEARAFWGDMLRSHGFTDRAQEQYDWVLAQRRWQVRAYLGRACILGMRGQPEEAHALVKELRQHYPWSIEAQQFLLAWRNGDLSTPEDFRTLIIAQ